MNRPLENHTRDFMAALKLFEPWVISAALEAVRNSSSRCYRQYAIRRSMGDENVWFADR
jgi:hypothetical protein